MRIAFITDEFAPNILGGAGVIVTALAQGFKKKGHDVVVVTANLKGKDYEYMHEGIRVFSLGVSTNKRVRNCLLLYNPMLEKKVYSVLNGFKPDVVNVHNVSYLLSYSCLKIARKCTNNVYFTAHDAMSIVGGKLATKKYQENKDVRVGFLDRIRTQNTYYYPFKHVGIRSLFRRHVKKVIVVSDELGRALRENGLHKDIAVARNGIALAKSREKDVSLFKKKHDLEGKTVFMFAGRTSYLKGFNHAVKIVEGLRSKGKDITLLICGNKGKVRRKWITYTGWINREDMVNAYASCEGVFVTSLYLDPFPTMNLETLSHGKLLITTTYGGSRESIDEKSGILINPFSVEESVKKVLKVLDDDKIMREMRKNGVNRYKELFTLNHMIDKYEKIFLSK